MSAPLTMADVLALAALDGAHHKRVRYIEPGTERERVGTLRGFRRENGSDYFPAAGQDIRDTWVRVTVDGWEAWYETMPFARLFTTGSAMVEDR